jgi:hypothetical protein
VSLSINQSIDLAPFPTPFSPLPSLSTMGTVIPFTVMPPQAPLYHLANSTLFVSYLVKDIILLRILIAIACIFFVLWGALNISSVEAILYNGIFFVINTYYIIIWALRTYMPSSLTEDQSIVYKSLFLTSKNSDPSLVRSKSHIRNHALLQSQNAVFSSATSNNYFYLQASDFNDLVGQTVYFDKLSAEEQANFDLSKTNHLTLIREYGPGEIFCDIGEVMDKLTLNIGGYCIVETIREGFSLDKARKLKPDSRLYRKVWRPLNFISPYEFLDSPEWFATKIYNVGQSSSKRAEKGEEKVPDTPFSAERNQFRSEVRMRVIGANPLRVFQWNSSLLCKSLRENAFLESSFNGVIGSDLARKVFSHNVDRIRCPTSQLYQNFPIASLPSAIGGASTTVNIDTNTTYTYDDLEYYREDSKILRGPLKTDENETVIEIKSEFDQEDSSLFPGPIQKEIDAHLGLFEEDEYFNGREVSVQQRELDAALSNLSIWSLILMKKVYPTLIPKSNLNPHMFKKSKKSKKNKRNKKSKKSKKRSLKTSI